jgi:hypothetical protein
MSLFIEEMLLNSIKSLLAGRVNELLGEMEWPIPAIEFGSFGGGSAVVPVVRLEECERTEKERIIRLDAYSLTIAFTVPEIPEGERNCYAYAAAVDRAIREDPALGGVADRAVLTRKKYTPSKHAGTGEDWGLVLSLRVTVEC